MAPTFFAWAFSGLGETDTALGWAERAHEEKSPPFVMHQATLLGDLRSDARFRAIRHSMKLEP